MTKEAYESLSDRDKLFMDVLLSMDASLRKLGQDISRDLEEMK